MMRSPEPSAETAEHAAEAAESLDVAGPILHHVQDSRYYEIPFTHKAIKLGPDIVLFGQDLSITKHVVMMWLAFIVLIVLFRAALRKKKGADPNVPSGLRNAMEVLVLFVRDEIARRAIPGAIADAFVPFLLTTFFFILTCNLLGLIPILATATGNISVTAGLALVAFVVIQMGGIMQYGLVTHVKNLMPPGVPGWLSPLIFLIEVLSQFIRPFALCIRLFANMMGGHVVILAFISMIFILSSLFSPVVGLAASPLSVGLALFVHFLELLVAFLQAFIFTMLTAQFIGMSVHPSH